MIISIAINIQIVIAINDKSTSPVGKATLSTAGVSTPPGLQGQCIKVSNCSQADS